MTQKSRKNYEPIDLTGLKTFPMQQRQHKVDVSAMATLVEKEASAGEFLESLPDFLGARQLRLLAEAIARAVQNNRPVIFAMGAHVIKVGCSPIIIDLMQRGILSGIVFNGSGGIHDFGAGKIVGGEHRDLFALPLSFRKRGRSDSRHV